MGPAAAVLSSPGHPRPGSSRQPSVQPVTANQAPPALAKKTTGFRHGLGSVSHWLTCASPSGTDSGTTSDMTISAGVAPPLHDTTARPVGTGLVPSGVRTRPSTLTSTRPSENSLALPSSIAH